MLALPKFQTTTLSPGRVDAHPFSTDSLDSFPVPEPEPLVDRFDLAFLIKKYFRVLIAIPAVFVLFGLAYIIFKQPIYESTALIYIDPKFDEILRFEKFDGGSPSDLDSLTSLEIMIMADSMVLRVAEKLDLRNQPGCIPSDMAADPNLPDQKLVRFLQNNRFEAHLKPGTRLLEIVVRDPDAERARLIASTFVEEFDSFLIEQRQAEARKARTTLEKQVAEAREIALDAEKTLREFRESHPRFPVEQDHDMFAARLTQFSTDLNTVVSQRMELESQLEFIGGLDPNTSPSVIVEVTGYQSAEHVRDILALHASAAARLAAAREQMGASSPGLHAIESEFQRHDRQLREIASEIKEAIRSKFEATKKREEGLRTQLDTIQHELVEVKSLSSEFRAIQQQAERQWLVHGTLQTRLSESVMATDSSSNIATEVSQPMKPYKKASPGSLIILIAAGGLGTMLSASWIGAKILTGVPYSHRSQLARHGLTIIADWTEDGALPAQGEDAVFLHALGAHAAKIIHVTAPESPEVSGQVAAVASQMTSDGGAKSLLISIRPNPGDEPEPKFTEEGNLSSLRVTPQAAMRGQALESYLLQHAAQFHHIFLEAAACKGNDVPQWLSTLSDQNVVVVGKGTAAKREIDSAIANLTTPGMPPVGLMFVDPKSCPLRAITPSSKRIAAFAPQPRQYAHSA